MSCRIWFLSSSGSSTCRNSTALKASPRLRFCGGSSPSISRASIVAMRFLMLNASGGAAARVPSSLTGSTPNQEKRSQRAYSTETDQAFHAHADHPFHVMAITSERSDALGLHSYQTDRHGVNLSLCVCALNLLSVRSGRRCAPGGQERHPPRWDRAGDGATPRWVSGWR